MKRIPPLSSSQRALSDRHHDAERREQERPPPASEDSPPVSHAKTLQSRTKSVRSMNRELSAEDRAALLREIEQLLQVFEADPSGKIPVGHFLMAQLKIELITAHSTLERHVNEVSLEEVQPVSGGKVERLLDKYSRERLFDATES